jgi:hypothetical protein
MPESASPGLQPYASEWRSSSAGEEFANGIRYYGNPMTENRKVEARKPLIFQHPIAVFCL